MTRFNKKVLTDIDLGDGSKEIAVSSRAGTIAWPGDGGVSNVVTVPVLHLKKITLVHTGSAGEVDFGTGDVGTGANFVSLLDAPVTAGQTIVLDDIRVGQTGKSFWATENALLDAPCTIEADYVDKVHHTEIS